MSGMQVTIWMGLLPDGSAQLRGYAQFWLRYVRGFSPHFHCQQSLRGENDPRFNRTMRIGTSYDLHPAKRCDYIYLCGVTSKAHSGLHLALIPQSGATVLTRTYNGVEIAVEGARELEIPKLPDGYAGMTRKYTSCRNWQFGVQCYGLATMRHELIRN